MATLSACLPTMHSLFNRVFTGGRSSPSTMNNPRTSKESQARPNGSSGSRTAFGRYPFQSTGADYSAWAVTDASPFAPELRDTIDLGDMDGARSASSRLPEGTGITVTTHLEQTSDRLEQPTTVGHVGDRVGLQI